MSYAFGQDNIAPFARDWEVAGNIPKSLWPKVAELGLGGIYVSEENGGSGLSRLDATLVFEALAMACPSVSAFLSIHNMCGGMIDNFGSQESKSHWLPDLCAMNKVFSYCLIIKLILMLMIPALEITKHLYIKHQNKII